ncbi:GPP34 family phosphoprotein [uncultured Jatrophihabitans sp.]|uniref:GPP34 family phosphoprotein n=1 Tax=uncultured Jatrophihabitans sp. TaxID=1610747 RepID=UPI0035C9AFAC
MTSGGGQDWYTDAEPIDSVALWLLRLGIDRRGQLTAGPPWDLAVRAGVLIDLRLTGRIDDSDNTTYIDEGAPDGEYEDVVCDQLLHGGFDSETSWIDRGRVRARDVAQRLVDAGEWRVKAAPLRPGGRVFRAQQDRYPALREHLDAIAQDARPARSHHEFATLVLADQLFALGGGHGALELRWDECGPYEPLVQHASIRIRTRAAMAQLGASGGGG